MKRILIEVLFCTVLVLIQQNSSKAQWEPEVRLTNNSSSSETSFNNAWSISAAGNYVHLVWFDDRNGNFELYYKRSENTGLTWGPDTRLTNRIGESRYPSICASGSDVHLVWRDANASNGSNPEIYYKHSTDGGVTWSTDFRLTNDSANSLPPSLSISGNTLHVVWADEREGNFEIFYKRSTDNGVTWEPDVRLSDNSFYSLAPSVSASGPTVHVAWHDNRDWNHEIYYKRSTDSGSTWGKETRLTDSPWESKYASISASGKLVHLTWNDTRSGNWEVHYKRSTDSGINWTEDTMISDYGQASEFPTIFASGQMLHVVWFDQRDGDWEVYYKRSAEWGSIWLPDTRISYGERNSWFPSVTAEGQVLHVMWNDEKDGNREIYYRRDSTGNLVGVQNVINEVPVEYQLGQNYPNPFNPVTHIQFQIAREGLVRLVVYDELGRQVAEVLNRSFAPGIYNVEWDGTGYSSGVYYYTFAANKFRETKKMILLK